MSLLYFFSKIERVSFGLVPSRSSVSLLLVILVLIPSSILVFCWFSSFAVILNHSYISLLCGSRVEFKPNGHWFRCTMEGQLLYLQTNQHFYLGECKGLGPQGEAISEILFKVCSEKAWMYWKDNTLIEKLKMVTLIEKLKMVPTTSLHRHCFH